MNSTEWRLNVNSANVWSTDLEWLNASCPKKCKAVQETEKTKRQYQQHIEQSMRNRNNQPFGASFESTTSQPSSANNNNSNQSYRQPSGTRLQFIVPGEQFDLYG